MPPTHMYDVQGNIVLLTSVGKATPDPLVEHFDGECGHLNRGETKTIGKLKQFCAQDFYAIFQSDMKSCKQACNEVGYTKGTPATKRYCTCVKTN